MRRVFVLLSAISACSRGPSPALSQTSPVNSTAEAQVARDPFDAIPREQMRVRAVPADDAEVLRLLAGRWNGKKYGYSGDSPDFEGEEGDAPRETLELGSQGVFSLYAECSSRGHYELEHEGSDVLLTLTKDASCSPGGAKKGVYYLHHVDGDIVVLIDGSTAEVVAFRRASSP